jgi:EAL domain-containing protein (putative c-di-GMP-specific phosphodiesterase class I)
LIKNKGYLYRGLFGEYDLNYQLKFSLNSLKPNGMESLLRIKDWNINRSPLSIIKQAEENGEIHHLVMWIFERSLSDFIKMEKFYEKEMTIAINVSPIQLSNKSFVKNISNTADILGVSRHKIELKLTYLE